MVCWARAISVKSMLYRAYLLLWLALDFFAALYGYIYTKYLKGKYNFYNTMLFYIFLVLWSLYGVFYFIDDIPKNVGFNVLDLFSLCWHLLLGLFYKGIFIINHNKVCVLL